MKRWVGWILGGLLALALVLLAGGLDWVAWQHGWRVEPIASPTASIAPTLTTTATATASVTATPLGETPTPAGAVLSPEIQQVMDRIEREVADLRQLPILHPVTRRLYTQEELEQRVTEDFLGDYPPEEAADDAFVLAALGLLPPDYDLWQAYHDLYTEQIAGFYDDEAQEMVVVADEAFDGPARMTYAHEFTHALQDQSFGLDDPDGLNYTDEACEQDSEWCAAVQALIEGDATLSESMWYFLYATDDERAQIQDFYRNWTSPVFDTVPLYLQRSLLFPYEAGLNFVQSLYSQGGWKAVNAAYTQPPVSTEQILHPDRYPDDIPEKVTLPDFGAVLGPDWEEVDHDVLGEWGTLALLAYGATPQARVDEETARGAAQGWAGDAYRVYRRTTDGAAALVVLWQWENGNDRYEFAQAMIQYASERFGPPAWQQKTRMGWRSDQGEAWLYADLRTTLWVLAPDASTAEALWRAALP